MSNHTPGPWAHTGVIVYASSDSAIQNPLATIHGGPSRPECMYNAKVIATAPELLAALQLCMEYLDCIPESAAGGDDDARRLVMIARAAIAKATGETI